MADNQWQIAAQNLIDAAAPALRRRLEEVAADPRIAADIRREALLYLDASLARDLRRLGGPAAILRQLDARDAMEADLAGVVVKPVSLITPSDKAASPKVRTWRRREVSNLQAEVVRRTWRKDVAK